MLTVNLASPPINASQTHTRLNRTDIYTDGGATPIENTKPVEFMAGYGLAEYDTAEAAEGELTLREIHGPVVTDPKSGY